MEEWRTWTHTIDPSAGSWPLVVQPIPQASSWESTNHNWEMGIKSIATIEAHAGSADCLLWEKQHNVTEELCSHRCSDTQHRCTREFHSVEVKPPLKQWCTRIHPLTLMYLMNPPMTENPSFYINITTQTPASSGARWHHPFPQSSAVEGQCFTHCSLKRAIWVPAMLDMLWSSASYKYYIILAVAPSCCHVIVDLLPAVSGTQRANRQMFVCL